MTVSLRRYGPYHQVMTLPSVEVGFVSSDSRLRDFLLTVFEFEPLSQIDLPIGTLHRLQGDGTVVKVFVPAEQPEPPQRAETFFGIGGLRFLTIRVKDIDGVIDRALTGGGRVVNGPNEPMPGVRTAMLEDPDGNTIEVSQTFTA